jgi:hypothetical protein
MSEKYVIYGLADPREPETVKYVGATSLALKTRLQQHCSKARGKNTRPDLMQWIASLLRQGLKPVILPLEECDATEFRGVEAKWIGNFTIHSYEHGRSIFNRTVVGYEPGNYQLRDKLKKWRGKLTQKEAAAILGVSDNTYRNWEYGTIPGALAMVEIDRRMKAHNQP